MVAQSASRASGTRVTIHNVLEGHGIGRLGKRSLVAAVGAS